MKAGRDFADSGVNENVDDGITIYILRDRIQDESDELKRGYREGFRKGYQESLMNGFYRR